MADLLTSLLWLVFVGAVIWAIGFRGLIAFMLYPWEGATWGNFGMRRQVLSEIEAALQECQREDE